jgi:hypothetical protein
MTHAVLPVLRGNVRFACPDCGHVTFFHRPIEHPLCYHQLCDDAEYHKLGGPSHMVPFADIYQRRKT